MRRPFVAAGTVRYVGQPVVAVIAEDRHRGADAAELVVVDYEPLPVVIDPEESSRDEMLLFPDVGTNVVQRFESEDRRPTSAGARSWSRSASSTSASPLRPSSPGPARPTGPTTAASCTTRRARAPIRPATCWRGLRPRAVAGAGDRPRRRWRLRRQVAHLPRGARARLLRPRWSGGRCAGPRPARRTWSRCPTAGARCSERSIGGTRDGRITAYQLDVVQDAGAFPLIGAMLPMMTHADGDRRVRHPERRRSPASRSSPTPSRPPRSGERAGRRRPWPSSAWSTGSPPRSAWTPPRCAGATSSRASPSRTRPASAPSTTSATTPKRSNGCSRAAGYDALRAEQAASPGRRRSGRARHRHRGLCRDHRGRAGHRVRRGRGARRRRAARSAPAPRRTARATTRRGR